MVDFFNEGMQKYREGKFEEAGELFQQELEYDDSNPKAWNALGICFSKIEQYDDASTCFENALMIDPGNATYEKNLQNNKKFLEKVSSPIKPVATSSNHMNMDGFIAHIIFIVKSLFSNPHNFFSSIKDETWKDGYKYFIAVAAFYAFLSGIVGFFTSGDLSFFIIVILGFILLLITPFINGVILYIGIRIMGGKQGLQNSLLISMYSQFPTLILGWIPIIGLIFSLVSLYLEIVGVKVIENS